LVERATTAGVRATSYTPIVGRHGVASTTTTDSQGTRNASFLYDAVGNLKSRPTPSSGTQSMTWDAEGHMGTSADTTGTTTYVYDADGNRLVRRDPAGSTLYLPGQELRYTPSSGAKECTRYHSHAGQVVATRKSGVVTWLSSDRNGTAEVTVGSELDQPVGGSSVEAVR
jgi:YD repeat-containing protein